MQTRIRGNRDGLNRRNESYNFKGRNYSRSKMVKRVERGLHPENMVVKINNRKYVKDKPDSSKRDNVNR
ncbi:DUF3892 domain-containing protein [Candidatus Nomurabacteria bacterium]|nr:DUF3892 domain-containing protein [Candidatus Nomurabacteria bacterium]